jgi:glycosyltransferase involved in cell wall biosynthesis
MHLVIIIPALNEEKTIEDVIARIPRDIAGIGQMSVVVVDDGSTDRTAELALAAGAEVVSHRNNRGVGVAFATGIDVALRLGADIIVNMDGDGQFSPEDIPALLRPILTDSYGFVTCTRFGLPDYVPRMPRIKKWGNRMMCHLVNWVIRSGFTDVSCGFRAYTRDTALRLNLFGFFTYTQESFIDLASKRVRMTEVPLRVRGVREFGNSRVAGNLWRYAFQTLPIILRAMRDTRPLTFFGIPAILLSILGLAQVGFVSTWWLIYERTSPWTSLIATGSACIILGIVIGVLALVADQVGRVKRMQDEHLWLARWQFYRSRSDTDHPTLSLAPSGQFPYLGERVADQIPAGPSSTRRPETVNETR